MFHRFLQLFLAHLIGDYVLQTPYLASGKKENLWLLTVHAALTLVPMMLLGFNDAQLLIMFISHWCIDLWKCRSKSSHAYAIDQTLHIAVLMIMAAT